MTVYADFTYYVTSFLGTAIAESDFPALALRASAIIDTLTFGRAAVDYAAEDNVSAIKNAMCAVAEEIQSFTADETYGVQSETVGKHSVTYASTTQLTAEQRYSSAAQLWLINTGLMFTGFASDEYGGSVEN